MILNAEICASKRVRSCVVVRLMREWNVWIRTHAEMCGKRNGWFEERPFCAENPPPHRLCNAYYNIIHKWTHSTFHCILMNATTLSPHTHMCPIARHGSKSNDIPEWLYNSIRKMRQIDLIKFELAANRTISQRIICINRFCINDSWYSILFWLFENKKTKMEKFYGYNENIISRISLLHRILLDRRTQFP